jgi:hypothetical protein
MVMGRLPLRAAGGSSLLSTTPRLVAWALRRPGATARLKSR